MSKYPYPVLSYEDSSYKTDVEFSIIFTNSVVLPDGIDFCFNIHLSSDYLKLMLEQTKARIILLVKTKIHTFAFEYSSYHEKVECKLDTNLIPENDTIVCKAMIITNDSFVYRTNDELLPIYGDDYCIELRRNDVLAISNEEKLTYSTNNNDFIKFEVSESMTGNGYKVLIKTNYVAVLVGPEFSKAYGLVRNNKKGLCSVFDSHIVFEVFVYILLRLIYEYDELKDSDWYILFEQVFMQTGRYDSFDGFIMSVKEDDMVDMDTVYKLSHQMTNCQIENSIIVQGRMEG